MTPEERLEGEHKEVYLHFGIAAFFGQELEVALTSLLFGVSKINRKITSDEDWDSLEKEITKLPLGPLVTEVQKAVDLPPEAAAILQNANKKRKHLIHHFFRDRAFEIVTAAGRKRIIGDLQQIQAQIKVATRIADALLKGIRGMLNISEQDFERGVEEMRREARAADGE
jgi:hypothetical protein